MIRVTRINHTPLLLNSDLIEHVETTPDTVISLTSGQKYVVTETPEELIQRIVGDANDIIRKRLAVMAA